MKTKSWIYSLVVVFVVWAGAAQAATVVSHNWTYLTSYTTTGPVPKTSGGTTTSMYTALANVKFADNLSYIGFCVAPTITLANGNYSFEFSSWSDAYYRAAYVMANAPTIDGINSNFNEDRQVRVVQSAIWAALKEDTNYFPLLSSHGWANPRSQELYNKAIAASNGGDWSSITANLAKNFSILQLYSISDGKRIDHQTLLINRPVPVPAAVWMLGSGLVGLLGLRWSRKE